MPTPRPLDDRTVEAFLAGRQSAGPEDALLASFALAVRAVATQPPPQPSRELAAILAGGLRNPGPAAAVVYASPGAVRRSSSSRWRRPRLASEALAALLVKLGTLGAVTKVAFSTVVAITGVTAAAAAGALPAPVQNTIAHAVNDVSPFSFPTTAGAHAGSGGSTATRAVDNHGVSGASKAISAFTNKQRAAEGNIPGVGAHTATSAGSQSGTAGAGSQSSTGLNRANSTPASGYAPTSIPVPGSQAGTAGTGSQSSTGLNRANSTPASGYSPTSVPVPGSQAGTAGTGSPFSTGLGTTGSTGVGGYAPSSGSIFSPTGTQTFPTGASGAGSPSAAGLGTTGSAGASGYAPTSTGR